MLDCGYEKRKEEAAVEQEQNDALLTDYWSIVVQSNDDSDRQAALARRGCTISLRPPRHLFGRISGASADILGRTFPLPSTLFRFPTAPETPPDLLPCRAF